MEYRDPNSQVPLINFINSQLIVGKSILDLSGRPLMAKVIASFIEDKEHALNKSQLIEKIYAPDQSPSSRLSESYRANIVKMISRARKILRTLDADHCRDLTWFLYDRKKKNWKLCQNALQQDLQTPTGGH